MYIMVDVESDGPIPGDYSMISLGAVAVSQNPTNGFYAQIKPISDVWVPEALAVSGFTREQTLGEGFTDAKEAMQKFQEWLKNLKAERLMFVSDNNGYDWQFVNWYFHHFLGENPFGHSSTNLGSLYKGAKLDMFANFKHLRKTKHTHNALQDSIGNAEAMWEIIKKHGIKCNFK